MSIRSQLLKGILEGCVLSAIEKEPVYGYELSKKLQSLGLPDVSEGTVYPVLLRLQKKDYIYGEMKPAHNAPSRKYYYLTQDGADALEMFRREWEQVQPAVNKLMEREGRP
ncbi:PadR family transcriptional regulator [Alteribacillus sp. HJP-4]|uniref:PadR family transcriptional regulator n=1 Tax=Alteribacillus sp. HJP-4 TaxID=2775394 RepID=UPI0035CD17A1